MMKLTSYVVGIGLLSGVFAAPALSEARTPEGRPNSKYKLKRADVKAAANDGILETPQVRAPADIKGPRPIIKAEHDVHDFGTVWTGPELQHAFTVTNAGDAPLEILKVRPSCGCTIAGDYPRKLAPGESGEFPFKMNSSKLRGNFAKHVTITSNDPMSPNFRLTLRGEVRQYVDVTPSIATFGRITDQEPRHRELMITNNTGEPLELELKAPENSPFAYKLKEVDKGRRYALEIAANPPFEEGTMNSSVVLATNVEQQKELVIRTIASVPPRLEVQPNTVLINDRAPSTGRPLARVLRFTNYGDTPAKLVEATVDDPSIAVAVRERKEGHAYTVEVQLPAGYEPPPEGRTITLKIEDPKQPTIEVPIRGLNRRPTKTARVERPKPDDLVGKAAPAFSLKTTDGKPLSNDTVRDEVTVLNFFAPNCGFCKKQIPRLETVRQKFEGKDVRFVNVSQKMGSKKTYTEDDVAKIIDDLGFNGELAINHDNTAGAKFHATGFPTMVVLGTDGKVAAANVGNIGDLESKLTKQLETLVGSGASADDERPVALAAQTGETAKPAQAPTPAPPKRVRPQELVGKDAPAFTINTVDGKEVSTGTVRKNAATVLNFFAVNCGFCKKQIPRLEPIRKEFEGKNVRFVNIAETMRQEYTEEQVADVLKQIGWNGEWARDPKNEIGPLFGATGFPTMVILGKSGEVEAANVGNIGDLETRVRGQLTALVEGKPIPTNLAEKPTPPARPSPNDLLGHPAPGFSLKTVDGKDVSNATVKQQAATVLNFFAPNCGFCKKQIPRVESVSKEYADKPVRFVNVVMTMGKQYSEEEAMTVLKDLGWSGDVARDPTNQEGRKFRVAGFPTMAVVAKDGTVQAVNVGNIGDLETRLKSQLDSLIAGKTLAKAGDAPKPAPARAARRRPAEELVGKPAPEFTLTTTDGKTVTSKEFSKHPATVLNFVAPNCGFCKRQVPNVEKVRSELEAKGVRFVNVAMKMGSKEYSTDEIMKVFDATGSKIQLAKDEGNQVGQQFKATSFPTLVIVDRDGKVAHVTIGAKPNLESILKEQLSAMVN